MIMYVMIKYYNDYFNDNDSLELFLTKIAEIDNFLPLTENSKFALIKQKKNNSYTCWYKVGNVMNTG